MVAWDISRRIGRARELLFVVPRADLPVATMVDCTRLETSVRAERLAPCLRTFEELVCRPTVFAVVDFAIGAFSLFS